MTKDDMAAHELGQLREILLAPIEERNKERDEKILDFVEDMAKSLTDRINELENRLDQLTLQSEDDRRAIVESVADAMGSLGQQLRHSSQSSNPYGLDKGSDLKHTG